MLDALMRRFLMHAGIYTIRGEEQWHIAEEFPPALFARKIDLTTDLNNSITKEHTLDLGEIIRAHIRLDPELATFYALACERIKMESSGVHKAGFCNLILATEGKEVITIEGSYYIATLLYTSAYRPRPLRNSINHYNPSAWNSLLVVNHDRLDLTFGRAEHIGLFFPLCFRYDVVKLHYRNAGNYFLSLQFQNSSL